MAGAGTGKTRTLTHRVAHLIRSGVPAEQIVLVTFTQRAAAEMIQRIDQMLGAAGARVQAGTFHRLAHRALQRHAERLGYQPGFEVLGEDGQARLMAESLRDVGLSGRSFRPGRIVELLALGVSTEHRLYDVVTIRAPHLRPRWDAIDAAVTGYVQRKVALNVMDFDDLLLGWRSLLLDPEAGPALRADTAHVLVDEYQDTSRIQASIAAALAADSGLCVVGDDAQAIYGFRGASPDNMRRFGDAEVFTLTENFRSSAAIIAVANAVIARATDVQPKVLKAAVPDGPRPVIVHAADPGAQAQFIAQRARELKRAGVPLSQQAVLYRSHAVAGPIREALVGQGINVAERKPAKAADESQQSLPSQLSLQSQPKPGEDALTLTTIHRAKGLEWDAVFVAGMAQGRFPSAHALTEPGGANEERRLMHVAATRARQHLYMIAPGPKPPSPFLYEVEPLTDTWQLG